MTTMPYLRRTVRLLAAAPTIALLAPQAAWAVPKEPPADPTSKPRPVAAVQPPDATVVLAGCFTGANREQVLSGLRSSDTDVRDRCVGKDHRFGLWPASGATNPEVSAARDRGLAEQALPGTDTAGDPHFVFIRAAAVESQVRKAVLKADPGAGVTVRSVEMDFRAPDRIVTVLRGSASKAGSERRDFTETVTDTLSATERGVECQSRADLDIDQSPYALLLSSFGGPVPFLAFPVKEIFVAREQGAHDPKLSPGCQLAREVLAREVMIPKGLKLAFSYGKLSVNEKGLSVGFSYLPLPRGPRIDLQVPSTVVVDEDSIKANASQRTVSVVTHDLRGPRFSWTSSEQLGSPSAAKTTVTFDVSGMKAGDRRSARVAVKVTDADGLTAQGARTVTVEVRRRTNVPNQSNSDLR